MAEKRQLELYLLRLVPHALRDDFMTVGVVVMEPGGGDLLKLLEERFGAEFDVGPVKGIEAIDPAAEMVVLDRDYLAPMQAVERTRRMGRLGIVGRMEEAFADVGVLGFMQRDIAMTEFTGANDPFEID